MLALITLETYNLELFFMINKEDTVSTKFHSGWLLFLSSRCQLHWKKILGVHLFDHLSALRWPVAVLDRLPYTQKWKIIILWGHIVQNMLAEELHMWKHRWSAPYVSILSLTDGVQALCERIFCSLYVVQAEVSELWQDSCMAWTSTNWSVPYLIQVGSKSPTKQRWWMQNNVHTFTITNKHLDWSITIISDQGHLDTIFSIQEIWFCSGRNITIFCCRHTFDYTRPHNHSSEGYSPQYSASPETRKAQNLPHNNPHAGP